MGDWTPGRGIARRRSDTGAMRDIVWAREKEAGCSSSRPMEGGLMALVDQEGLQQ